MKAMKTPRLHYYYLLKKTLNEEITEWKRNSAIIQLNCGFSAIAFPIKVNSQIDLFFPSQFIDCLTVSSQF